MTQQHAFILKAKTRPEQAEAFEQLFRPYVEPSRQEPGCLEYHMLRDQQDPSLFVFFEVWASKADLDVHSALPHMRAFFEKRMDYLERDFEIQSLDMLSVSSASR
ncbi:putative quinol monooxygenase [Pseudomonas muyukensis]|uniref:Antibiotic biosynthesis monooxygenase n=1 Tax=Pseudomonas muyukensis TaxID=2842357 RepID=A0ABX8MC52_9PSED|nr:putative quinol monooxygenase [Pseudomonas muyukensis]QXH36443.1 antibiotic biosynthesis monooxygenase [Pseudomonas muyukensis]